MIRDQRPFPRRIVDPDPLVRVLETLLDVVQTDEDDRVENGDLIGEAGWDWKERKTKQGPNSTLGETSNDTKGAVPFTIGDREYCPRASPGVACRYPDVDRLVGE